ncbi:MAG: hypothetical protein M1831_004235 [Alyxoria varia]|nr:MAG: hypothetical protein M1831_004235 [Alyxoria varia]
MIASTTISRSARSSNTQSATSAPTFASPISRPGASSVHKIRDYQAGVKKSMHLIRSGAATHAQVRRFAQKIMATPQSWNAAVPLVRELRELPADHNEAVRILWNATKRLRNAQVKHPNPSDGQIRHLRVQQAETRARLECLLPNASVAQRGLITTIVDAWTMLLVRDLVILDSQNLAILRFELKHSIQQIFTA